MQKSTVILMMLIVMFMGVSCTNTHITNLEGTWSADQELIAEKHGWVEKSIPDFLTITEQKGHVFKGFKTYTHELDKKVYKEMLTGSISESGHIVIVEHEEGLIIGQLENKNTITFQYVENINNGENPMAIYITLKRNE
ncbi:MAG: hypothetical protein K9N05_06810 [Candidatus Marinimicrobia bacterium]|nr:hypothetical protein [Candidatus Neomarinimicrobiota bacterium]